MLELMRFKSDFPSIVERALKHMIGIEMIALILL